MIIGAHTILYSRSPDADRAFLRDVLKLTHIDVGGGWLIFGLPPSEVAIHPTDGEAHHELYLLCEDIQAFVKTMGAHGITCSAIESPRWGLVTKVMLPGGGELGVYQPLHPRPAPVLPKAAARRPVARKLTHKSKKKTAKPARRAAPRRK